MKILVSGDFVPTYRVKQQLENHDFKCLNAITSIVKQADYSIVNLEAPVVDHDVQPINKTGPNIKCSEKSLAYLSESGFNCVTLANNHFRDYDQFGVENTLMSAQKYSLDYVGGGKNLKEAEDILYKEISGSVLAIINVCECEWSIATDVYGGSAPLSPIKNFYTINEARKKADIVLVVVHGGIEHYQFPTPQMVDTYRFFIDAGADAVINHHQHCYSGYEEYQGKPIFYGLGNLCFDTNLKFANENWYEGYMVLLDITTNMVKYDLIPYIQCKEQPLVILKNQKEKQLFFQKIDQINAVIHSKELLRKQFDDLLISLKKTRLNELEPISNKYIRALQNRRILPSFISRRLLMNMNNIITCQSHRDVILGIFAKILTNA